MDEITVHAVSLGCPKNRVDTEKFLKKISVPFRLGAEPEDCQLILVNTCAFIEPATRESIRTLLELSESQKKARQKPLFVAMGCLPARYSPEELKKEFPEIDFWISGSDDENVIKDISGRLKKLSSIFEKKTDFGKRSCAYVKISDGCDHRCAFCAIPYFKGKYVSNPLPVILEDTKSLLDSGVGEIILVAQDLLSWGKDLPDSPSFIHLLEKLLEDSRISWLRLLYLYPSLLNKRLIKFIAETGEPLLPYFDVPFQHSEANILRKMGRPFKNNPREIIRNIREIIPEAAIRTTLMTGFPGESEKDFDNLCKFVEESAFSHLGVFVYHAEEGTPAYSMPDQIPMKTREERKKILMDIQAPISRAWLEKFSGREMQVIVDESAFNEWPGLYKGRVWFQAPEIDGLTYISGENLEPGQLYRAEITDSSVYDLSALQINQEVRL